MKVIAAGATGAIGQPLIEQLVRAGHEVTGMTRSAEGADRLQQSLQTRHSSVGLT